MAAVSATDIAGALAQEYPEVFSTVFRTFVLAQIIPTKPGKGKNDSFDVKVRGTQVARKPTDGQDVTTYVADTYVPATGEWAEYDAAVKVTGKAMAIAGSSGGTAEDVKDQFGQALNAAFEEIADMMAVDAYAGADTSPYSLIGLSPTDTTGLLGSSGTIYNIDRGSVTAWAGNVLRNGGVKRPITAKLLDQSLTQVFNTRGTAPKVMITTSALCDSLKDSFGLKYVQDISVGGRPIVLQGGYRAIVHNGIPIVRDPHARAGTLLGLDTDTLSFRQLINPNDPFVMATTQQLKASGTVEFPGGSIPMSVQVKPLSIGGNYVRYMANLFVQLRCSDPAKNFVLGDLR